MDKYTEIMELFQVTSPVGYSVEEVEAAAAEVGVEDLPLELKSFFLKYGKSPELQGLQDSLILPDRFESLESDYIIFYEENQAVCQAGVKKSEACLPDPPVYVSADGGEWKKSSPSVSDFLVAMYGYQASICLPFNTEEFYWITQEEKEKIEKIFTERPQRFDNWLYDWNVTLFGDNNEGRIALMENGGEIQMQYSANTESEFKRMNSYLESIGEPI